MTARPVTSPTAGAAADEPDLADGWVRVLIDGLSRLREQRHWTQADLAERSGLHRETIGRLERLTPTATRPNEVTLAAVASAFGYVHLSDFWRVLHAAATTVVTPQEALLRIDDVYHLVLAYLDCTPEQQRYLRGIANIYAARRRSQTLGELDLIDLTNVPSPVLPTGSAGGRKLSK